MSLAVELEIPAKVPQGLTIGDVRRALRLREETIKRALSSGALPSWQIGERRGWRYVTPEGLAAYAHARGLTVYWSEVGEL